MTLTTDTPEERTRRYRDAMARGDASTAYAIVRAPMPAHWREDERRPFGAMRDIARIAAGLDPSIDPA